MIPEAFEYLAPKSLDEAISLLEEHGDDAKILAGGHSLIPMMKLRLASPEVLIDINGIDGLADLKEENGYLVIGAMAREVDLEDSELIKSKYHLLYETTTWVADPSVRNFATIGGNLAHGDPANDHPATMLASDAEIVAHGPDGERVIPIEEFFTGFYEIALEENEILTAIRVPIPAAGTGGAYQKIERKAGDYATVAIACQITLNGDTCTKVGIGLTNVGPTPIKAKRSEALLTGKTLTDDLIAQAAQLASEDCSPSTDLRAPADYKVSMVRELTIRAIQSAVARAKGGN